MTEYNDKHDDLNEELNSTDADPVSAERRRIRI